MKIAVGLSGGVDSAVSAALLVEQGHEVTGVFLECWNEPGCRTDQDRQDALGVALKLKIPFKVLDFKREYKEKVLEWFYKEYKTGRTPNPDVVCNREIKFGMFLEWAMKNKFERVATGHYAQIRISSTEQTCDVLDRLRLHSTLGRVSRQTSCARRSASACADFYLMQSVDKQKDQTYFLALLKQKQLEKVMFPIGHLTKKQVRVEAKKRGFKIWNKKDSTGICLIGHDYSFEEFLKREIKEHEGEVVNKKGRLIGQHKGVEFYTIGQRHGFTINAKFQMPNAKRQFVVGKEIKKNRLVVGSRQDLARQEFEVEGWGGIRPLKIAKNLKSKGHSPLRLLVRIRHQGRLIGCKIEGKKVFLEKPEYGIAPGQVVVIYNQQECLGGGIIK